MTISLDAASAEVHDRIRGVAGAWAASARGIKRAIEVLKPRTSFGGGIGALALQAAFIWTPCRRVFATSGSNGGS
jgi:hypothetical protein